MSSAAGQFVLDTGIVIGFQKAGQLGDLADASRVVPIKLTEEVHDELVRPRNGKHAAAAAAAKAAIGSSSIGVVSIDVREPAARTLDELRTGKTSLSDLGEAASIAWSLHHEDCTFVTNDAAAALQALAELRGRTMAFFPFVAHLVEAGALSMEAANALATKMPSLRDWHATVPTWWATFTP